MEFDLDDAVAILSRTPAAVRALVVGLPDRWIRTTEGPETFSPRDVVGHLIDGEETDWIPRARRILDQGESVRFDPYDRFRHFDRNVGRSIDSLIDEFDALRARNLELLRSWKVTVSGLNLYGEHPTLGRVTLRQLLAAWVAHDLGHLAQIARVMAKQYAAETGPWIEFLPVLTDRPIPRS